MGSLEDSSSPVLLNSEFPPSSTDVLRESAECEEAKEDYESLNRPQAHVPPGCAWDVPLTYHREPSTPLFFPRFKHVISMLSFSAKYANPKFSHSDLLFCNHFSPNHIAEIVKISFAISYN